MKEYIQLTISDDKMLATLTVFEPEEGAAIQYTDLAHVIDESGIQHGVNQEILDMLKYKIVYGKVYEIAVGDQPTPGKEGRVDYHFATDLHAKPAQNDDGSVDFHNLGLINNVEKGDVLVTLIPEVEGQPGMDVLGEEVPAPSVKKVKLPKFGKGIKEKDNKLMTNVEGHVDLVVDKVVVSEVLTINGDVDTSTGDINYNGSVIVSGNVLSGFSVKAKKNIEVMGLVEGATLLASGNIIIRGGIQGMDKARLICNGRLVAKYIFNAFVKANDVINTETILHSIVSCNDHIVIAGKGLISGGKVRANKGIDCKVIGTNMGTKTAVEVGIDPDIKEKFHEFKNKKNNREDELKKVKQIIKLLEERKRKGVIKAERLETLDKSYKTREKLETDIKTCERVLNGLLPLIENVKEGSIKIETYVYSGVVVSIGSTSMVVNNRIDRCTLVLEGGKIRVAAY